MLRRQRLSIRAHYQILAGSVVIVVAWLLVVSGFVRMRQERASAEETTQMLAAIVAGDVTQFIDQASKVLDELAFRGVSALSGTESCTSWHDGTAFLPPSTNALVVRRDGEPVCAYRADVSSAQGVSYLDRAWFEPALESDDFVVTQAVVSKMTNEWMVGMAKAIRDDEGRSLGAATVGLRLAELGGLLYSNVLPTGSLITLTDRSGTVLARSEDPDRWVGTRIMDSTLDTAQVSGLNATLSAEGEAMLFGFREVGRVGWRVFVGVPTSDILAPVRASVIQTGLFALAGSIMVLLMTANGYRRLVRPLGQLADSTRAAVLGKTDEVKVDGPTELVEIAALFDEALREKREMESRVRRSSEELRALNSHVEQVREEERMEVARELHDEIAQVMTALRMDLSWIRQQRLLPDAVRERIDALEGLSKNVIDTGRRIATRLRPSILDDLGLLAAAEWLTDDFGRRTGIECVLEVSDSNTPIDPGVSTALFRILQEALTNVIRHAEARTVVVRLDLTGDNLLLEVEDDGRGMNIEEVGHPLALGMIGMRERAAAHGGTLRVESGARSGTAVRISVPRPSAPA